MQFYSRFSG